MSGMRIPLLFALTLAATPVSADLTRDQALQLGKDFGNTANTGVSDAAANPDLTVVPDYQGTNVPETQYYGSGLGIEDAARQNLPNSEVGTFVQDSALSRPRFTIERNDPIVQRGDTISADPEAVLGQQLSGQYSGCQEVTTTTAPATFSEEICTEWGMEEELACQKTLNLACNRPIECDAGGISLDTVQSDMRWTYSYPYLTIGTISDNYWSGYCAVFDRSTTFTIEDIGKIQDFTLIQAGFDDWIRVAVNGTLVYVGPYGGDRLEVDLYDPWGDGSTFFKRVQYGPTSYGGCELSTSWNKSLNVDIKPYLRTGLNTIDMRVIVAGGGEGWMKFKATQYCDCDWTETWESTCGALEQQAQAGMCVQQSQTCVEPAETRLIDGIEVYRDCWRYDLSYRCATGETREEPYCQELRERGCSQVNSTCVDTLPDGSCYEYQQTYRCPQGEAASQTVMDCGGQTFCLDGNCFDAGYEPNQDFALAASHLGELEAAANDFDTDNMEVFKGQDLRCKKTVLGFSNCCKDSGWGLDLSLAQCSEQEIILGQKREAGQCHYIGSYCSIKSFFGCLARKNTYCCFNSKLGRIIQEQGHAQLGIGWGSAKNPECRGFTPQELTSIDFANIDFTEFYADAFAAADSADRPSDNQMQQIIEQGIKRLLP
ncbi:conjugal transfer protein TraN [Sedimenticola hydrogenitrophicus]|uniref:conjugal transfer protein TraN n=1 Tax=Sedimenticola hydrogenitrophicus TaxID=2967975 RepID=UPI0023AFF0C2|nr:conjugal transfer protein TraN [Sedimenticola hydrogenitrophicus]